MPEVIHKLAVIMFTDIVGYTALMDEDEDKAFEILARNKSIQKPIIEKYKGTWLKEIGDGLLLSFDSTSNAVLCAREILKETKDDNDLSLRIGIHLGEVAVDNNDVLGSGVNIASRIQELAAPNSILISDPVYRDISNKKEIITVFVKEEQLRNVSEPIRLYEVKLDPEQLTGKHRFKDNNEKAGLNKWLYQIFGVIGLLILIGSVIWYFKFYDKPAVSLDSKDAGLAIMPFKNISGNEEVAFLSYALKDEIHEVLALSKEFSFLSSSMATARYNERDVTPQVIGKELGVDYILSGSHQIAVDSLIVRVEFLDAYTGNSVWNKKFVVAYEEANIIPMQTDIANSVLAIFNKSNGQDQLVKKINLEAYQHYLKGNELFIKNGFDNISLALEEYEKAFHLDSTHTPSWVDMVRTKGYILFNWPFWLKEDYKSEIEEHIRLESMYHPEWAQEYIKGIYQYWVLNNLDEGLKHFTRVLEQYPDNTKALTLISAIYKQKLELKKAYKYRTKTILLNPNKAGYWNELAILYSYNGEYKNSLKAYLRTIELGRTRFPNELPGTYASAGVPFDSIPKEYIGNTSRWKRNIELAYGTPRSIIDAIKTLPKDTMPGGENEYTFAEYYFDLAHRYRALYMDDSARYFAKLCIQEQKNRGYFWRLLYESYLFLGEENKAKEVWDKHSILRKKHEFKRLRAEMEYDEILNVLLNAQDYKLGTDKLIKFNNEYPNWGRYNFLNDYMFNRVKKEYPPFAEAVANLKLPPPLDEDKQLQRLKY